MSTMYLTVWAQENTGVQAVARVTVIVDDNLHKKFRMKVIEKYGTKKGAVGEAVEEAIRLWLDKHGKS